MGAGQCGFFQGHLPGCPNHTGQAPLPSGSQSHGKGVRRANRARGGSTTTARCCCVHTGLRMTADRLAWEVFYYVERNTRRLGLLGEAGTSSHQKKNHTGAVITGRRGQFGSQGSPPGAGVGGWGGGARGGSFSAHFLLLQTTTEIN